MRLLRRTPRLVPAPGPAPSYLGRVHNFDNSNRYWGHDIAVSPYTVTPGRINATGWGHGISKGDYLLVGRPEAPRKLKVLEIEYGPDPQDFWSATLSVAP
jgi:hypothetical protein